MNNVITKLAHFFSFIFSPLLVPTYAIVLAMTQTVLAAALPSVRVSVSVVIFIITCVVPLVAIGCMYKLKLVSDPGLNNRSERTLPFIVTVLCYGAAAYYLSWVNAPMWLVMFMVGALCAAVTSAIVNGWWKISAHGAAMGGLVGMMCRVWVNGVGNPATIMWFIIAAILAAGIVGTSRLILERHTLGQVLAGTANGFLWVFLLSAIH